MDQEELPSERLSQPRVRAPPPYLIPHGAPASTSAAGSSTTSYHPDSGGFTHVSSSSGPRVDMLNTFAAYGGWPPNALPESSTRVGTSTRAPVTPESPEKESFAGTSASGPPPISTSPKAHSAVSEVRCIF
jgi:hypothetical protein